MTRLKAWIAYSIVSLCFASAAYAQPPYEEAGEFVSIKVQYHTKTMGIIWAYQCSGCLPKRFVFNQNLQVQTSDGFSGPEALKVADSKAAAIFWRPNTFQALRVLPMIIGE